MSNKRRLKPGRVGLYDQMDAAYAATIDGHVALGILNQADRKGQTGFFHYEQSRGPTKAIVDEFTRRDDKDTLYWCRHLRPDAPQPATWQAWRPDRLYCITCVNGLPQLSGKEDRRCDACGHVGHVVTPCMLSTPAKILPGREGKPAEARPPVTLMFGLCKRCDEASQADAARVQTETRARLRLPGSDSPLDAPQAAAYRTAVTVTRCWAARDQEGLEAALLREGLAPNQLLWGQVNLIVLITDAILDQAEFREEAVPPSFDEILASFTGSLDRWVSHPVIKFPGELADMCDRARRIIMHIKRGDFAPFEELDATGAMLVAVGAMVLLLAAADAAIPAGLAASADQVWQVVETWIRERERR
jgi:hypothetical protein